MSRVILILSIMFLGLSARADVWSYSQPLQPAVPAVPAQPADFNNYQYNQPYNQLQGQGQYPNNNYYNQPLSQYNNPYQYRPNPYAGYNNYGYATTPYSTVGSTLGGLSTLGGAGVKNQIIRNIGQNVIYSMMRGY